MAVELQDWTARLREEYLADFIPSGGAAVKIAIAPPEWAGFVLDTLAHEAREHGFRVAKIDAAQTRVHMIDQIFYAAARQVDWDASVERWLRTLLQRNGLSVAADQPLENLDAIAAANGRSRTDLIAEIHRLISNSLAQNYSLTRDFRTALIMLCWGRLNPQNVAPSDADVVKQWLLGERCSLATLKRMQIYSRIGRHNARILLASMAAWLHDAGASGLTLLLNLNAALTSTPAPENLVRYTRNTILDVYEVLRQFIDDTDETTHLLLGVAAGPGLLDDPKRSVDNYTALKLRIMDDVRDEERANPLNTMVRLGTENGISNMAPSGADTGLACATGRIGG